MFEADELTNREIAILRAVGAGRAELLMSCAPGLAVDGGWCDYVAVWHLVTEGLIRASRPAAVGQRVPAVLTESGHRILHPVAGAA